MARGNGARIRKTFGLFFGQTALFILVILAVCMATPLHIALLRAFDAAERTGLSPDVIEEIAHAMVSVMQGADREILTRWFTADEVLHMKDVQWLFSVGLDVFFALCGLSMLCMIGGKRPSRRECRRAFWLSVLLPAAIAVPFIANFNGMFIWLHRIAFPDNELWLMNPEIHMMVVVYNEQFFITAVAVIGILCALSLVPLAIGAARGRS